MKYLNQMTKILSSRSAEQSIDVSLNDYGLLNIENKIGVQYDPSYVPSLYRFLSDPAQIKIIIGPYGSGKTSGIVNQILCDAVMITPCDDGVRRSRWAIVRNTAAQLETTVRKSWMFWAEGLPRPKANKKFYDTYMYKFNDEYGEINLEVIFVPLDSIDDIRKLESFELTGCFFNELRHISESIFNAMLFRIRRYPEKINFMKRFERLFPEIRDLTSAETRNLFTKWNPYQSLVYADSNPPKANTWIHEIEKQASDPDNKNPIIAKVFHQPPALLKNKKGKYEINPEADNLMFVGEDYYLHMIGRGEEFIRVYAQGKYGVLVDGKAVYSNYNDDLHCVDDIEISKNDPIYLGWDFGTVSPACILKQIVRGQIRAIKEFVVDCEKVDALCKFYLFPYLSTYCKGMQIISTHDPANTSEGAQTLFELGIESSRCRTNHIEPRLSCTSSLLDRLHDGKIAYVISRKGCPTLREGFLGEYHFRRLRTIGEEKYVDVPNKVHPYSDIHDANQYVDILIADAERIKVRSSMAEYSSSYSSFADNTRSKITGY